ncbi:uncharacterized protein LOC130951192 [Arachis stenosperma]|uniref:uncharacterized protein LOC130951192 n=1 Tax=Arachis stenosperma TaxID=217475 RepID=UPI0025AC819A|nr:uncharacterized protein LOC130951192 [Arachis stenosperma]XP_057735809.1 uncharacterized protein LOC130951192 [Arachis stenosperma]XP_057735810.1 uncharacterized protein LOC130951192 [Arachis stenosperma]XP_057735811.1 uncharacterized protein LOC130951192 [Arachis stenosperma]XP_057735812.1 uncharacterized protein LOC130951192 [Arachis stenosperma]
MPRGKRIKNPLKFVDERENNNASRSLQPLAPAAFEDTTSVEASEAPSQAPSQAAANSISSDGATRCSNSKSSSAWNVEIIDSTNMKKKAKIKVKDVCNLPRGDRVIVEVDEEGAAYGEAQGLLAGYCGILATNARIFPISFEKWSGQENGGMPKSFKDECFDTMIKPHFHFTSTEKIAYRYCIQSIAKKWATYRQRLWNEFYDPTMRREALVNNVPDDVPRDQWACFVNYRLKPSTVELCMKNKENRSKQTIPHTCGSKSNSRRRHEMYLETGKKPSRGMMYIETHKRKDGSFVNNEALTIVEQIELNMTQSNTQFEVSPNDAVGKVLGPEHSGRVRCMGMGAAPTNTFRNVRSRLNGMTISTNSAGSSSPTTSAILQEKINNLESDLHNSQQKVISLESKLQQSFDMMKAYLMMKEGGIPEALVGFFSAREANDAESEPTTPFDARRSAGDSNGHPRTNI